MMEQDDTNGLSLYEPDREALRARIAELEEQLRLMTLERDELLVQIHSRPQHEAVMSSTQTVTSEPAATLLDADMCELCEGEGIFSVHDFRMEGTRCNGTSRKTSQSAAREGIVRSAGMCLAKTTDRSIGAAAGAS